MRSLDCATGRVVRFAAPLLAAIWLILTALGHSVWANEPGGRRTIAAGIDFGRYHALIVGNNVYANLPNLETAVSDAAAVAELLRSKYGFKVQLLLNAKRAEILGALSKLRSTLTEADQLLIYYAGHGTLDETTNTGYWLPVDAEEDNEVEWIANDTLTRFLKTMSARHVMVVADSCFSGTLVRSGVAAPLAGSERWAWLRRMNEKRARTALVSGGLEPVVDTGRGGHSVFANAFLQALRNNGDAIDGQQLFKKVRETVVIAADQTPQYSDIRKADHAGGDFVFVPQVLASVTPPAGSPTTGRTETDREAIFWQSIQNSTNPSFFEAYLSQYPGGTFAPLARLKLQELTEGRPSSRTTGRTEMGEAQRRKEKFDALERKRLLLSYPVYTHTH